MSGWAGALGVAVALIAEDILVGTKGGPSAVTGVFSGTAKVINDIADPNVPAIPNRADKGA